MRRARSSMLPVLILTLLVGAAQAEISRTSGLIAENTKWVNPYYIVDSAVEGPTLLVTGGLHGNEPAGYRAAEQIRHWPIRRGKLVVVPRVSTPAFSGLPKIFLNTKSTVGLIPWGIWLLSRVGPVSFAS